MSEAVANGIVGRFPDVATHPKDREAEATMSPPKRKSVPDFDRPTDVIPLRPSQWIVDVTYAVKVLGTVTTAIAFALAGTFWAAPTVWADGIKPVIESHVKQNDSLTAFFLKQQEIVERNSATLVTISNLLGTIDARLKKLEAGR